MNWEKLQIYPESLHFSINAPILEKPPLSLLMHENLIFAQYYKMKFCLIRLIKAFFSTQAKNEMYFNFKLIYVSM